MTARVPLGWLRSFEAAARHASFTRAADELNVTQAAVSKQIRALEARLGCVLFSRHAHGVQLTDTGRRYWQETREPLQQLDKITEQFVTRQQSHKVHVRCNISYSALVLHRQLAIFARRHPDVAVDVRHDIWKPGESGADVHLKIAYRLIDATVNRTTAGDRELTDVAAESTRLLHRDHLFPVVGADVDDQTAAALPLIHVAGFYQEWSWWLEHSTAKDSLPDAKPIFSGPENRSGGRADSHDWFVDNSLTAYHWAGQGLGIALGRSSMVAPLLEDGVLRVLDGWNELNAPEGFYVTLSAQGARHGHAVQLYEQLLAGNTAGGS